MKALPHLRTAIPRSLPQAGAVRPSGGVLRWALRVLACVSLTLCPGAAVQAAPASKNLSISQKPEAGLLEVFYGDQKLLVYAYGPAQYKPYVKELYTLKGDNVLLDAPADHLHHHGLMYAIRVNGVNFWEEVTDPGHQVTMQAPQQIVGIGSQGLPQAAFTHSLSWVDHAHAKAADLKAAALLLEQRTLIVSVDPDRQEVAVQWRSEFEAGAAAPKVTLAGADYHGLGVRFPRAWDRGANHLNSDKLPYPTKGKRDVLAAKWSAVVNAWQGHEATLALFARPAETRGTTRFFSMLEPFTYLSVTQGLDTAPLEYDRGSKFSLNYLVLVYPAVQSQDFLGKRYEAWKK